MTTVLQRIWFFVKRPSMLLELCVALCLAFLVWLYAHSRAQDTLDNVLIPVSLQLSPGQQNQYEMDIQGPRQLSVSFGGPASRIRDLRRQLQRGLVKAVIPCAVPEEHLKDSRFTERIVVEAGHIATPPGVWLVMMEESATLQVTYYRLVERQLPVRLEHPAEIRVRALQMEPAMVTVRGPQEVLDRAKFISTQPYSFTLDAEGAVEEASVQGQVDLVTELNGRPIQTKPDHVAFTCRVHAKQQVYQLNDVPVSFLCPCECSWRPRFASDQPSRVNLRVTGPPGEELPPVQAFVDLTKGNLNQGRNLEPVRVQLPRDFQLVPQSAPMVGFYLDEVSEPRP